MITTSSVNFKVFIFDFTNASVGTFWRIGGIFDTMQFILIDFSIIVIVKPLSDDLDTLLDELCLEEYDLKTYEKNPK